MTVIMELNEKNVLDEKNEITTTNEQIEKKPNDSYSIYEYLKNTPSVLIAIFSGLIATISFLIKFSVHIQLSRQLSFWNVDPSVISNSSKQFFYIICFSFLLMIVSAAASSLLSKTFSKYIVILAKIIVLNKKNGFLKKLIKKKTVKKKTIKKGEKRISEEAELKEYNDCMNEIIAIRKDTRKCKLSILWKCILDVVIFAFLFLFINVIIVSFDYAKGFESVLVQSCIITAFEMILSFLLNYLFLYLKAYIVAKPCLKDFKLPIETIEKDEASNGNSVISKQTFYCIGLKPALTNRKILVWLVCTSLYFILIITAHLFIPFSMENKEFKLFSLDNQSYVSVFSNDEMIIVERAEIHDEILTVYTNEQKIIPIKSDAIAYKTIKVNSVEKIE